MLRLGVPEVTGTPPLPRRFALVTAARLVLLSVALALVAAFYLRGKLLADSFTLRTVIWAFGASFLVAGVCAAFLRVGAHLERVAHAQLIADQLIWTVLAYLTGGAASGATSFYGLSCLIGASLTGMRGATVAALAGGVSYGAMVMALEQHWLSAPPDQPPNLLTGDELTFYVLVNLLVLTVVTLLAGTLAERLRWTGGELEAATARAAQAERMAALGRLAAGLAHEIRNPLGSIAGSIQLLRTAHGLSDEDQKLCEIVQRETNRLNDLVTDMVDLARPKKPILARIDAARTAREVVELAAKSGRAVSDVDVSYQGVDSVFVLADGAQLRQLIWNLLRNAVQASSPGDTAEVAVENKAGLVTLRVTDRGAGIDAVAKARIFDAFFTTRSQGTGVGLAVVKRIADEHGFTIDVESDRGRGATFRVALGRAQSTSQPPPA